MKCCASLVGAILLCASWVSFSSAGEATQDSVELSIRNEGQTAIAQGIDWLLKQQMPDGSWGSYPAVTALAVSSILKGPFGYDRNNSLQIAKGLSYIMSCVKPDGSIAIDNMPGYNTSVCLMALEDAGDETYHETILNARNFLIQLQFDESDGYQPDSCFYGGIGYGQDGRPDLSNIQWALEALKASEDLAKHSEFDMKQRDDAAPANNLPTAGESGKGLFWDKAILFLERCQNLKSVNKQEWAGADGGFVYYPDYSKAGGTTSYGSMTYAGLKSFIYADIEKDDPRVQAAFDWIRKNYTVDENPEMGLQGLYYYYHTMAKALNVYGDSVIQDDKGAIHNWREDLIVKLCSLQNEEGYWVNSNGRWWENNKVLVTSYCILALEETLGHGGHSATMELKEGN
ncbi:MAG: terpene cyclase/mutase family protein [Candidatus Krumholzibacteria bacterium]|nr:terpene cyclase/mutase family protein [Candidatus Krumholzibacteria bacterium]